MRRRLALVGALLAATAAAAAAGGSVRNHAGAQPAQALRRQPYRIVDLGTLRGASSSYATAINERGQVIGVSGGHAFLWTKGKLRDLGSLGGRPGKVVAINEHGDVVLTRGRQLSSGYDAHHAFLWQNGKLTDLGTIGPDLGGDLPNVSDAVAINDRRDVLANSSVNQNSPVSYAFVWRDGERIALTEPGDWDRQTAGAAINERGQVAGWIGSDLGFWRGRAFLWSKGRFTDVGTLPGRQYSRAVALNDHGALVGESYDLGRDGAAVRVRGFLWRQGKLTNLGTLRGDRESSASAINNRGEIVGESYSEDAEHAFLWRKGKVTALGAHTAIGINDRGAVLLGLGLVALINEAPARSWVWRAGRLTMLPTLGGKQSSAAAINDHGRVVGWSRTKAGKMHAALWIPRS